MISHDSLPVITRLAFLPITVLLACGSTTVPAQVPDSYRATWKALRPKLDENIERYRKGDARLEVVTADGKPAVDAAIAIRQKSHEFLFGCNILVLGQLGDRNAGYEEAFVKLFNLATTTLTWNDYETQPGKFRFAEGSEEIWRRPPPDRVVAFCKKHGITVKGQPLLACHWYPKWGSKDPEEAKKLCQQWFAKVAERYGKDIQIFDVVNESLLDVKRPSHFPLNAPDLAYVGWAFQEAQKCFPDRALLTINEGSSANGVLGPRNEYYPLVKRLIDSGAGVEGVGFQFHLFTNAVLQRHLDGKLFAPDALLGTYDSFGKLGRPLFITEITIPTTLAEGAAGEVIQAEVLANLYRLWFSVPDMAGITYWNLCDGAAWKNEGNVKAGLLDENMRRKPAYAALDQLINHDWKTSLSKKTDSQGRVEFRGYQGKYEVTAVAGGKSQTFEITVGNRGQSSRLTLR